MLYSQTENVSVREFLAKKPWWLWVVIAVLFILGVSSSVFGVYQLINTNDQEVVSSTDISAQVCEQSPDFGQITVYISGAVENPGVYILNNGDRIASAVDAAGGISTNADTIFIHRQFNLAQKVTDGEQIYIPTQAEAEAQLALFETKASQVVSTAVTNKNTVSETGDTVSKNSLIKINSSTKEQLMELSGIGSVRAVKIIENRPYSDVSELVEKGVISQSLFDDIRSQISL